MAIFQTENYSIQSLAQVMGKNRIHEMLIILDFGAYGPKTQTTLMSSWKKRDFHNNNTESVVELQHEE